MSSNVQTQINDLNAAVQALESSLTQITGNTMSNYNQLSRIVSQQANIYNTLYYGSGNIVTGNLSVSANALISGNLILPNGNLSIGTTISTANFHVNGTSYISGNLYVGDFATSIIQTGARLHIRNNSIYDTDINGSISGNVLNQISFGNRSWVFATDALDSQKIYFGCQGGSGADPDFEYYFKRNVGLQIQPNITGNTSDFTEALKVVGDANITGNIRASGVIFGVNKYLNQMTAFSGSIVSVSIPTFATKIRICTTGLTTDNSTPIPELRFKSGVSYGTPNGTTWGNMSSGAVLSNSASGFYLWNSSWSSGRLLSMIVDIEYIGTNVSGFPMYCIIFSGSSGANNINGAGDWTSSSTSRLDTIDFFAGSAATFDGGFYTISYIC